MRRSLLALAAAFSVAALAPSASATHPCPGLDPVPCWVTNPCISKICP